MFTIAGGILIAALILGGIGLFFVVVSHWFGNSESRAKRKQWEKDKAAGKFTPVL